MTNKNTQDLITVLEEHLHRLKEGQKLTSAVVVINYDESETTERVSMTLLGDSEHIENQVLEITKAFHEAAVTNHLGDCKDPECGITKDSPIGFLTIVAKIVAHVAANYGGQFDRFCEYLEEGMEKCSQMLEVKAKMDELLSGGEISEMTDEDLKNFPEGLKDLEPGKLKMLKINPENIDKVLEALGALAKIAKGETVEEDFEDPGKPIVPNPSDRKN